ncbi:MAG TPA: ThuA domain-containing protein [Tepidisphaeraceae bacterium]|nr:ThuA domain-containing protein [Tepidisphaeraceae bacterium]
MSRKALIVWGGWEGHQPKQVAEFFGGLLREEGFEIEISDSLGTFDDQAKLLNLNLIVPIWTMGTITDAQVQNVLAAVKSGVGIAGCHGTCDSFRDNADWQFMTGGQFVAHPGNDGTKYTVKIGPHKSPIMEGIKDFEIASEQYYMHIDPAVKVLATTRFPVADGPHAANGAVDMPVIWTKLFGKGKVFYDSIGHLLSAVKVEPNLTIMRRGLLWAARV